MSCIYKYKGKNYTKDEFYSLVRKSNFIQQEQQKKFAELQERLNNKEFLEGAKNAYESSKGLQEWGTQEQYNDYIARVSLGIVKNPSSGEYNYTSKVKDIVYHGGSKTFEQFRIESENRASGTSQVKKGIYLSRSKNVAKDYVQSREGITNNALNTILNTIEKSLGLKEYDVYGGKEDGYTYEEEQYKKHIK